MKLVVMANYDGPATRRKRSKNEPRDSLDRLFASLWAKTFFYAQDNPPNLESPSMKRLYQECLRRIQEMIERIDSGESWERQKEFALHTLRLTKRIFPEAPSFTHKEFLVWLGSRDVPVKRAVEIADDAYKPQKHRPNDPQLFHEAIRAYDLSQSHMNATKIADKLCQCGSRNHSRKCVEKIRQRVQVVHDLFNELGLSTPQAK